MNQQAPNTLAQHSSTKITALHREISQAAITRANYNVSFSKYRSTFKSFFNAITQT